MYTKNQINKAGDILKNKESYSDKEIRWAEDALTYWRTLHGFPVNEFQQILRKKLLNINKNALVVQRIKRSPSTIAKLKRIPNMQLARMQDIGGVRVIVDNVKELRLLESVLKSSNFIHELKNTKDYLLNPKTSGYRSIHLVYKYRNPDKTDSDGVNIEVQIRTKLQHTWATAVETLGTFLGYHLKFSEGQPKWLKYFALTSSAFTFLEKTPPVPGYDKLSEYDTFSSAVYEFRYYKIKNKLESYSLVTEYIFTEVEDKYQYHLVILDTDKKELNIKHFQMAELEEANKKYTDLERKISKGESLQVVLVSTDSINNLRDGFPNYFLDTQEFLLNMEVAKKHLKNMKN